MSKKTIVFDFDGVIHSYKSGWKGITIIPDKPVEGIKEVIAKLRELNCCVAVVSTRCATQEGLLAVTSYLEKHNIVVDMVCKEKPPALVYIDDRALRFDGDCSHLLEDILNFKNWLSRDFEPDKKPNLDLFTTEELELELKRRKQQV